MAQPQYYNDDDNEYQNDNNEYANNDRAGLHNDNDFIDDDDDISTPPAAVPRKRRSGQRPIIESDDDDVPVIAPPAKRMRGPSEKQKQLNEDKDATISRLRKESVALKRKMATLQEDAGNANNDDEFESEEETGGPTRMSMFPDPPTTIAVHRQSKPSLTRRPRTKTTLPNPPSTIASTSTPTPPNPRPLSPSTSSSSVGSTSSTSSRASASSSSPSTSTNASVPPNQLHTSAQFPPTMPELRLVNGVEPATRPALGDYTGVSKRLIGKVLHEYSVKILTNTPVPAELKCEVWMSELWLKHNQDMSLNQELTPRVRTIIKARGPHTRSSTITRARPCVSPFYGFVQTDALPATRTKNLELYQALMSDHKKIMYKDYAVDAGYVQNPLMTQVLNEIAFKNQKFVGIKFEAHFNPIPIPLLALVLTAIRHCIEEFSTGLFVQSTFEESFVEEHWAIYMLLLQDWRKLKPDTVDRVLKKMHDNQRSGTGARITPTANALSEEARSAALRELDELENEL